MNLAELKEAYKARKLALDSAKKEEEKYKALLKDAMLEAGESDYTDEAGYRFERIVQERKSMDEEKLLAELHERNLTSCIATKEVVDEDATLKAVEAGELPQEVLGDAIMGSKVYGVPYEDCREFYPDGTVNAEGKHRRTTMKSVLLGIMYERGAKAIGEQFDRSAEWAQKLIDDFYKSFPKIQQLRLKVEKMAEEYGYVTTIQGRKRRLPEMQLPDHDDYRYQEAHRQSLNAVIQGSSADIMKLAMIAIYNDPQYKALDCHMVITVHDELIMEVPEDHIKEGADLLVNTMKRVGHSLIDLPMSVDAEVNDYWYGENLADEYLEEE